MAGEEARMTAIDADLTHDEMTARVTAAQADVTHEEMVAQVTAAEICCTETLSGTATRNVSIRVRQVSFKIRLLSRPDPAC